MFEAILENNIPIKRIQATSRVLLIGSIALLLGFILLLIWQTPISAALQEDQIVTPQQIRLSVIETFFMVAVLLPLTLHGKRVFNNLTQSQSMFHILFQDSVEPILLHSFDGRITSCNPACSKMLGYGPDELKQMRFQDLIVSDGHELAYLFRTGESGVHSQATLALQTSNGQVIFVVAHEQHIHIRGKGQLLAFLEDITTRHIETQKNQVLGEITSTLLETRDKRQVHQTVCAEITKSADSLVVLLGTYLPKKDSLRIVASDGNPQLLENFHTWSKESLAHGINNIHVPPHCAKWLMETNLTAYELDEEQIITSDSIFPHSLIPLDSIPPAQIMAQRLYEEKNVVTTLLIYDYKGNLDISFVEHMLYFFSTAISRLAAQEQVTRSELQLSETQELVKVGRLQYDFTTDRTILSKELCAVVGVSEETNMGEMMRLIHPEDQHAFAQFMDKIIEYPTYSQLRFNFRMLHADGHTLYLRSQSKVHFDESGNPQYLITAIHDATEIMSTRDLLKQRQADLAMMAQERQLLEERVSLQVTELEDVNKNLNNALMVKDEFLASMSSNLKAPLTAILGATELLTNGKKGRLNTDQLRYVDMIERSGDQLLSSINAILDLTKFSLNKEEISQEKVSVRDLCQSGVLYTQTFANRKNVTLHYDLKIKKPFIIGDPIRLRQIVTILLKQAVQAARENGSVRLNVFTHTDPQYIWLQILDNGTQSISTILEPTRHGLDPHSQETLELEIASRLVELHGGTLEVFHQNNRGNTVTVLLPIHGVLSDSQTHALPPDDDSVSPSEAAGRG